MKKVSIREMYYFSLVCAIFMFFISIAGIVIILLHFNDFANSTNRYLGVVFAFIIVGSFVVLNVSSLKRLIVLSKDYKAIKTNEFITITATVVKFENNRDPESGRQIRDRPIVRIAETNEEIVLDINVTVSVGKTYEFNYLKNSKIAEIVEK